MRMNIFGSQMAVKNFLKRNTINFLNYALILRRSVLEFEQHIILTMLLKCHCNHLNMVVGLQCPKDGLLAQYSSRKLLTLKRYHQSLFLHPGTNKRLF
jgi:hypothetical protein